MKKIFAIIVCSLVAATASAQISLLDSLGDYEARFTKLNKAYAKSPDDVEALYNMAQFYFDNSHPMRNLPMAMKYIQRAETRHIDLLENDKLGELTRLARKNITLTTIRQTKQAITDAAYNTLEVRTDMTRVELDTYLDAFGIDIELVRLLRQRRINQVYDEDLHKGTPEAYYHFIDTYPGTDEAEQMEERLSQLASGLFDGKNSEGAVDSVASRFPLSPSVQRAAEKQKSRMAYAKASKLGTIDAYRDFLSHYPTSDESQQAREHLDDLMEVNYSKLSTAMQYGRFANANLDLPLADKALAEMRKIMYANHDAEAARYYLEHFKLDDYYSEVYNNYYQWHAYEGNGEPIKRFQKENPDFPFKRAIDSDLANARVIDKISLMEDFLEINYARYAGYVRQMTGKGVAIVPLQRMIQTMVSNSNWNAAIDRVRQFSICFEKTSQAEYAELLKVLSAPASGRGRTMEMSATYDILGPVINAADGRMYFTRSTGSSRRICYAVKEGGKWRPAGVLEFSNTNNEGLTLYGFYGDGTHMLLGSAGDIWFAEKDGDNWRVSDIPPYPVNSDYIETDAFMLPDGSGILLASDRPGGYNLQTSGSYFHGDTALATDLYFIPLTQGQWGTPVNLGPNVNTQYCERSPMLSRNLRTLYFVSDGRGGLGYGDVYEVERTSVENWTSWSKPKNIGKGLNTGFREQGISFSPDEKRIYLSANSSMGHFSAYSIGTSHETANSYIPYTLDILGMESSLYRVRVADLSQQNVTQVVDYSGEGHSVDINVHKDKRYAVLADAGVYFVPAVIVDPKAKAKPRLKGYTFPVAVSLDKPLPLYAVEFDGNTSTLLPVAQLQLEQLAQFLANNDGKVEFSIDVTGSDDTFCYTLSLERGRAIKNFLAGKGVDENRVIISAYGNVNVKRQGSSGVAVRFRQ